MNEPRVTIGDAAAHAGVSPKAIRLYEQRGLLEPTLRTDAGYRTYGPEDLAVLRFIRQAKAVGLRLDEVARIIDLQRTGQQPCATVIQLLDTRLSDIDRQLVDLTTLRATLATARDTAEDAQRAGRDAVICTVIETATTRPDRKTRAGRSGSEP